MRRPPAHRPLGLIIQRASDREPPQAVPGADVYPRSTSAPSAAGPGTGRAALRPVPDTPIQPWCPLRRQEVFTGRPSGVILPGNTDPGRRGGQYGKDRAGHPGSRARLRHDRTDRGGTAMDTRPPAVGELGRELRALRLRAALSQEELAHTAGLSVRAVADLERGRSRGPHRRTVLALAKALELDTTAAGRLEEAAHRGHARRADLRTADAEGPPHAPRTAPPFQLPPAMADFTGRAALVRELSEHLTAAGTAINTVTITGTGGIGKTTLAVQVAHRVREHFPGGQLYTDLQGAGNQPVAAAAALGSFLRALGVRDDAIPDSLEDRTALYRSLLAGRRTLVLLDNARDAAQVRPLLPGTANCAVLVTSRARMTGLEGARPVDLEVLTPGEALTLFTRITGRDRVAAEPEAARATAAACGFLPLAIRIAASRLAARRTWTVSVLAAKLADEHRRIDELATGDLAVHATFTVGYSQLEPETARAFRLLSLPDGPDISLDAASALLALQPPAAEALLESLVDTSLLEPAAPGRYRFHDLVRLYARSRAEQDEPTDTTRAALLRLLAFYLATATHVYTAEEPGCWLPRHLEHADHRGLPFPGRHEALDWLWAEADTILACARQSAADGHLRHAADLLWAAHKLAESGTSSLQYETAARAVLTAARTAGDLRSQGRAHTALAAVHMTAGRYGEADEHARAAESLARHADDPTCLYWAVNDQGISAFNQGRIDDAGHFFRKSLDHYRTTGNKVSEGNLLCNLSRVNLTQGQTDEALQLARRGLGILLQQGTHLRVANARYSLGIALIKAGRHTQALEQLQQALKGFQDSRERLWEGTTHVRIAQAHLPHNPKNALHHAETALTLGCVGGDTIHACALLTLGHALDSLGHPAPARARWREALALCAGLGTPEEAEACALLADSGRGTPG
ncbi:hypothetical protein CRV15_30355 (plasmid) [Streptomyces clavuligerus]|nr:hypothetical protein CRV15_30355 [Streptomyces clavuligerus]QPJ98055.1 tetratricopeptide repeat protein [Streptomyces clavuligerus]